MSVRRAQDERIEGTPDGLNPITEIVDVPDAPTIGSPTDVGTSRPYNNAAASVPVTANVTGGTPATYTVTSSPGGLTGSGTSPVTVTGLNSQTSYTFTAVGVNTTATGPASTASSSVIVTSVPDAPTAATATNQPSSRPYNNGQASVSFSAPASGGKTITSYTATSSPGGFTASGSASPLTVTGLASATSYTFTVTATNANGTGSASSASGAITATTVPQAPTIGTFTDGGTGTTGTLSFTANATGGSAITNYKISTDNVTFTALSPAQTSSPLSLSGLSVGTATYYIKAVNTNGDSAASSGVSGTVLTPTNFDSIATATGNGTSNTITFSSIPGTYKALVIRTSFLTVSGSNSIRVRLNGDTGNNYAAHNITGAGTTPTAANQTGVSFMYLDYGGYSSTTAPEVAIIDIMDYASTSKNKTIKIIQGVDQNGSGSVQLNSGLWLNTSAITSVTILTQVNNFSTGSTFALYGVN